MKKVKVKFHDIIASTDKAVCFLFNKSEIWLPKALINGSEGNYIKLPIWLAKKANLNWKPIKEKVVIEYNTPQELKFKEVIIDESLIK